MQIIQLTDTHLGRDEDFILAGLNTRRSLGDVLSAIRQLQQPSDLITVTGDIAANGESGAYRLFSQIMSAQIAPFAWLPGNHDDFPLMKDLITQPFRPVVETEHWQLLFLNTAVPNQVGGYLAAGEMELIQKQLAENSKHIALFMHHPPIDIGCKWLDAQQVSNRHSLAQQVAASGRVRGIFTGHVHQSGEHQWHGCKVYTAPSTCVQFSPNSDEFSLSTNPPGYRIIQLLDDGNIETRVHYLAREGKMVDRECVGY